MLSETARASRGTFPFQSLIPPDEELFTFREAMSYLRVSRSKLYDLMLSGQLTGYKVGSMWRFYRTDLRACVRAGGISAIPQTDMQAM
jgi:excisionase family DNA binding protein